MEKKEQELNIDDEGDFVAVVNVENIKGDALVQLEGDETAFQSILISSEEISDGVLKDKDLSVKKVEKERVIPLMISCTKQTRQKLLILPKKYWMLLPFG